MKFFRRTCFVWIGLSLLVVLLKRFIEIRIPTFIPEWIDHSSPPLQAPSLQHFWGTDELGRDVLIRLLFGTGYSLIFSLLVALLTSFIGVFVGVVSSIASIRLQRFLILGIDIISALPFLPLALVGLTFYPGHIFILGALKVSLGWGSLAQLIRMESQSLLRGPMIEAAKSQGLPQNRILRRHLLPMLLPTALSYFPLLLFSTVLALATLDYFGLGFPIPTPTLAEMFRQFQEHGEAWWLFVFPFSVVASLLWVLQRTTKSSLISQQQQAY